MLVSAGGPIVLVRSLTVCLLSLLHYFYFRQGRREAGHKRSLRNDGNTRRTRASNETTYRLNH
jgi:hypothetical protein